MHIDHLQIVKSAWSITWKYKWLWLLALLALLTEGAGSGSGSGWTTSSSVPASIPSMVTSTPSPLDTPHPPFEDNSFSSKVSRVLGSATQDNSQTKAAEEVQKLVLFNGLMIGGIILVVFVLMIVLLYVGYAAKAGLILSVDTIEEKDKSIGFKEAFHSGRAFAWRLFGLNLFIGLIFLVIFLALALLPTVIIIFDRSWVAIGLVIALAIIDILILIVVGIYLGVVVRLSERTIVLNKKRIIEAFYLGRHLTRKHLGQAAIAWLVTLGSEIFYGIVIIIPTLLVLFVFIGFGIAAYLVAKTVGAIIFGILAGLVFVAALILARAIFTTYLSSYWTLFYRAIKFVDKKTP